MGRAISKVIVGLFLISLAYSFHARNEAFFITFTLALPALLAAIHLLGSRPSPRDPGEGQTEREARFDAVVAAHMADLERKGVARRQD